MLSSTSRQKTVGSTTHMPLPCSKDVQATTDDHLLRKLYSSMLLDGEGDNVIMLGIAQKKREAPAGEKPKAVRTHLRNIIIVPEMTGSIISVYNGKFVIQIEIKPEMTGHYLGEFSFTYKPVKHGRPGIGATHSSRFIPLK
ncbi:hypothetical protein QYE76_014825 [Lolium multiflorum]|uniref:40S ribosomal protein S15 n=1 Tax=Lolium multiflorum TaxID=4521 RepID=A0AAD8U5L1_LOLMU|nr:hypothetical protein QYE76_014825 [Lolium multiflorum]